MAVTANAYATDAAVEILELGGNALDAAVAAQWVLNLVEPQSSGIGGGGFMLHWDARQQRVSAWDGRETAPRGASANFARRADGSPAGFGELLATGRAVGVPGLVAMLEAAHRRHGKLRWERLIRPALRGRERFVISRVCIDLRDDHYASKWRRGTLLRRAARRSRSADPVQSGVRRCPARCFGDGANAGMRGWPVALPPRSGSAGVLTTQDMSDYRPQQRCLCGKYLGGASAACRRLHPVALACCNCWACWNAAGRQQMIRPARMRCICSPKRGA